MSDQKWTKEPWEARTWEGYQWPERRVSLANVNGASIAISARYVALDQAKIDLSRAAECVNALAGIENPGAVRGLVEAARAVMEELFSDAAEYDELGDYETAGMLSDPAYRLQDALAALKEE